MEEKTYKKDVLKKFFLDKSEEMEHLETVKIKRNLIHVTDFRKRRKDFNFIDVTYF